MACRRGGLSNTALSTTRRRRRRFPVIKGHACMPRGLLVRQSLVIGVFSLIGHTTSIRAVVCLRLPVAIYVLYDALLTDAFVDVCSVCIFCYIFVLCMLVILLVLFLCFMVLSVVFLRFFLVVFLFYLVYYGLSYCSFLSI